MVSPSMARQWRSCTSNRIAIYYLILPRNLVRHSSLAFHQARRRGQWSTFPQNSTPTHTFSLSPQIFSTFLALDLGGTNLYDLLFFRHPSPANSPHSCILVTYSRVCKVQLNGDQTFNLRQQKYKVSDMLKTGEATALFGEFPAPISTIRLVRC